MREAAKAAELGEFGIAFMEAARLPPFVTGLGWKIGVGPSLLRDKNERIGTLVKLYPRIPLLLESDWPQPRGSYN